MSVERLASVGPGYVEWWDEPERNARLYRHLSCDEGNTPWIVPLDDSRSPTGPTQECARCCCIVPLRWRGLDENASRIETIAENFHEMYELLAPASGYETRSESRVLWERVPEPNRELMRSVVADLLERGIIR